MCRGASLGVCCAQDCNEQIRCQDTGGYCDAHNPYDISWDDDDVGHTAPQPVDDPEKRRAYSLNRLTSGIKSTEASIRESHVRLAQMRDKVRTLEAEQRCATS